MLKLRITNTYYIVDITNYITNAFNINNIINIAFSTILSELTIIRNEQIATNTNIEALTLL